MAGDFPEDLRYTESDEWVRVDGDEAVIGVSSYAAEQLGDVVYVQLPEVGKQFGQGEAFGEIESVKAVSDLNAPLAGEVLEVNQTLDANPGLVNEEPYGNGWMVRMRLDDSSSADQLLSAQDYEQKTQEH